MPNSPRFNRGSLRHLSPDFDWDLLEQQTSHLNATEDNLPSLQFTADSNGKDKKERKEKEKKKGAIPKTSPPASNSFPEFSSSLQYHQARTLPNTKDKIIRRQSRPRDTQSWHN